MSTSTIETETSIPLDDEPAEKPAKKGNAHVGMKIVSVLLLAAMIAGLFIPFYFSIDGKFAVAEGAILGKGGKESVFFLMLSLFTSGSISLETIIANKWIFGTVAAVIVILILTVITLCTRKAAPVWFRILGVLYFATFAAYGYYIFAIKGGAIAFDVLLAVPALAVLCTIIHGLVNGKGKAVVPFLCLLLLVGALVLSYLFAFDGGTKKTLAAAAQEFYLPLFSALVSLVGGKGFTFTAPALSQILLYAAMGLLLVNVVFTYFQMGIIRNSVFSVIRYLLQLILSTVALVLVILDGGFSTALLPFIAFVALALITTCLSLVARICRKKAAVTEEAEEETEEEVLEEMETVAEDEEEEPVEEESEETEKPVEEEPEETEEPVAEEPAQEPAPVVEEAPAAEEPVEEPAKEEPALEPAPVVEEETDELERELYEQERPIPSYNPRSYRYNAYRDEMQSDDFLRTLTPAGKREFKKIFLSGNAPAFLPDYEIGGDNTEFFDSLFLYLGKVRTIISDSLLSDIYDYMIANN